MFGCQGMLLRENKDGNDSLAQLILLRGVDHPSVIQRLRSEESGEMIFKTIYHL